MKNRAFIVLILILGVIILWSYFVSPKFEQTELSISLGEGKEVKIKTSNLVKSEGEIRKNEKQNNYIDSKRGFSFDFPKSETWSRPKYLNGPEALIQEFGPKFQEKAKLLFKDNVIPIETLWPMIKNAEWVRVTSGIPIEVEYTEETVNEVFQAFSEWAKEKQGLKG